MSMTTIVNRYCERCERVTHDGHLWCQDRDCPAEESWPVFQYGDYLGDLKITRLISVWRTAALYEAETGGERNKRTVWIKVAHATTDCEDRLRAEAVYLKDQLKSVAPLPKRGLAKLIHSFFPSAPRPILLQWMPASSINTKAVYGETTVKGVLRVYCVYAAMTGVTLRETLLENPQVWHYEAAWSALVMCQAMKLMVQARRVNLSLSPRVILIDVDKDGHWRPTLLDLGWLLVPGQGGANPVKDANANTNLALIAERCEPAYLAPEIVVDRQGSGLSLSADVYSLGLIYFEMLFGAAGIGRQWRRDDLVIRDVVDQARRQQSLPVDQDKFRPELNRAGVVSIVESAISARSRLASVTDLGKAIGDIYHNPPPERLTVPIRLYILIGVLLVALAAVLVVIVTSLLQRG